MYAQVHLDVYGSAKGTIHCGYNETNQKNMDMQDILNECTACVTKINLLSTPQIKHTARSWREFW